MSLQSQRYGTLSLEGTDTALKAWWLSTATYHLRDFAGEPGESWEQTDSAGSSELSGIPCNEWLDETNIKKKKKSPTSVANPGRGAWRQSRQDLSCILALPLDSSPTYAHVLTPSGVSVGIKGYPEGRRLLCWVPGT